MKVRIAHLEVANQDQEGAVRDAQRALFLQRTAAGSFDEDGQLELNDQTLRLSGGMLHAIEVARLRAGFSAWLDYARKVKRNGDLTLSELHHELDTITDGLAAVLNSAAESEA